MNKFKLRLMNIYHHVFGERFYKKIDYNFKLKKQVYYLFFKNLYRIGYRYFNLTKRDKKKETKIIKVFQQKYLPKDVSGKIDQKTFKICHFLATSKKIS